MASAATVYSRYCRKKEVTSRRMAAGLDSVDGTTFLGEDDLHNVRSAVADLAGRWKDLGISLGILLSDLDAILSANAHSPSDCLREMLVLWLKQNYNVERFGKPTWRRLVEAAEDKVGGNNCALAQKIATEHLGTPGKKHRKLEIQQQSRLHPEKGHTSTDPTDVFILPQYIQVMVSNYQPLQTIFSIPEGECHTRPIKTDEQFSPTVTIVDAATQQPLDCVLLLHGEKPPEVNSRTLFCYIAVQVSYHDEHGSHPYPLYHMESKPCTQGNLPFIFSFHQPGTLCVIQLSIHSIVDSEGVEYMHHSEDCRCIVRIIDRKQHYCQSRTQHGAVRMKGPPRIRYTGPLATTEYHKIVKCFKQLYLSSKNEQIPQLAKRIIDCSSISVDIKVDAMCWEAFVGIFEPEHCKDSEKLFEAAMNKASQLDCQNSVLLQGMILKHLGYIQYANCNDDEALKYISAAREILTNAVPSQITAQVLFIGLMVKWRKILSTPQGMQDVSLSTSSLNKSIEGDYDLLLEHADFMEEYEQPDLFLFLTEKASFHLRSLIIEDKLPPKALHPSQDDIKKAEHCLNRISVDMLPNQVNPFAALYYRTLCDLFLWKQKYSEALAHAKWGKQLCLEGKIAIGIDIFTRRLQLLESLMLDGRKKESEDEAIDKILKEFSGETIQP